MPTLTRRRSDNDHQETWHVYYGDIHVGTIGERAGCPVDEDQWKWSCGFYPGLHPGRQRYGTAANFAARVTASKWIGLTFFQKSPKARSMNGAGSEIGPLRSIVALIAASTCHQIGDRVREPQADLFA
jgi:hypothetical protein